MPKRFYKYKLLFDENLHPRLLFPRLNHHFDIKHIAQDFNKSGIKDKQVYNEASKLQRVIVTFNGDDFKQFATKSKTTGVIALSVNMTDDQIDKKLTSFLMKNKPANIFRKYNSITGET